MLLKNYATAKKTFWSMNSASSVTLYFSPNIKLLDGTNKASVFYNAYSDREDQRAVGLRYDTHFHVGTGTTPATVDDYCLENDVTSSFSQQSYQLSQMVTNDGKFETAFKFSGINNSGSTLTISEVGIDKFHYQDSSSNQFTYLIFRDLLPTPVTVEAGQSINLIVKIAE